MALSNWDTLAIGTDGKSCVGIGQFKHISVEIYKNWVYINSPEIWKENMGYSNPVIASFADGHLSLGGIELAGKRGPQNSVFIYASDTGDWEEVEEEEKKQWKQIHPPRYFSGIGCYGFGNLHEEYLKSKGIVLPAPYEELLSFSGWDGDKRTTGFWHEGEKIEVPIDEGVDLDPWIGVSKETLEEFKAWLKEEAEEEYFNTIDWDNLLRFNQGDAYITNCIGGPLEGTSTGEAQTPLLLQALRASDDDQEDKITSEPPKPEQ